MYIQNATYKTVPTGSLSFPLAEGAVVTAGGVTGIVPENLAAAGPTAQIYVAVGGTIDLRSEANKGVSFTDEQVKALGSDFNFIPAKEIADPVPEIPEIGPDDAGKVLAVNSGHNGVEWKTAGGTALEETGHIIIDGGDGNAFSSNLTGAKISGAFNALTPIKYQDMYFYPQCKEPQENSTTYYFTSNSANATDGIVFVFQLSYTVNDSRQISEAYLDYFEIIIGG